MEPDTADMTSVSELTDHEQIALARKATEYLTAFRWCSRVRESFLAFDVGYVLGVFLFRIEPRLVGVDEIYWVVVGDCPPAHLVCDDAPDWVGALRCYVYEMQRWADAVRSGEDHLINGKPFSNATSP